MLARVLVAAACQHVIADYAPSSEAAAYETSGGGLVVRDGPPTRGAVAWGTFEDSVNITGWGKLDIRTSSKVPDVLQYTGAGMVEGFLTSRHIYNTYLNVIGLLVPHGKVPDNLAAFLLNQSSWATKQVKSNPVSNHWQHVGAVLGQLDGLRLGYIAAANQTNLPMIDALGFQLLSAAGDIADILSAVDPQRRRDFDAMSTDELRWFVKAKGMCSGLVKLTGDFSDLFMGHSTWILYGILDRIFKHYHFEPHAKSAAKRIAFSSYPGFLVSVDDFYMMDSGLGMIQTSNSILNMSLYELVKPESLLAWQRVRVANAMAHTGEEWSNAFRVHASGTYNNQYMIVDFNKFKPRTALQNGTLWVVEEIPGLIIGADQTETLRRGYWPSYNVPYYREIYGRSGYKDKDLGPDGSYELAPRAKIFRRDQGFVTDMQSLKRMLRYANYSDPYALKQDSTVDYSAAICMRGDFVKPSHGPPGGCIDTKVTSYRNGFWNLSAEAVNGPTSIASDGTDGRSGNQPFVWQEGDVGPHHGVPTKFAFDFVTIKAKDLDCSICEDDVVNDIVV